MWHYVLLLLRRQQGKSVLASSGFFLAACALVLLSATSQTTVAQGNQIISQSWRSSYDLVVLPPQAQHASHNTIPADLLEGYNGGISTQQYEQIRHLSGVEVAAPIAFLGYVQMPVPQLFFFYTPLPTGFYRVDLGLVVFTGQRQIVERGQSTLYYHFASCDGMPTPNTPAAQVLDALSKQDVIIQCGTEQIYDITPPVDPGTFLIAAIDPTAENQLVHLDKTITAGRMLTTKDNVHVNTNPQMGRIKYCPTQNTPPSQCISTVPNYDIPVLFQTQLPGRITLKGSFTRLSPASLDPKTAFARGGFAYLAHLPSLETIFGGEIPLVQNDPQRFSVSTLVLDGHNWLPYNPYNGIDPYLASLRFLYAPSSLTYASTRGPDGQASSAYTLVPDGTQGPEAAFRRLQPVHIAEVPKPTRNAVPLPKAFYFFDFTGKIAGNTLNAQFSNPLNWLPENTYASPPTVLRYDAQGNSVAPTNLLPTNNTAGFILQPPLVLTTLNAAVPGSSAAPCACGRSAGPGHRIVDRHSAQCHSSLAYRNMDFASNTRDGPLEFALPSLAHLAYPARGNLANGHIDHFHKGQATGFALAPMVVCFPNSGAGATQPCPLAIAYIANRQQSFPVRSTSSGNV